MQNNINYTDINSNERIPFIKKIRNFLIKPKVAIFITIILIGGAVYAGYNITKNDKDSKETEQLSSKKIVSTMVVNKDTNNTDTIKTVGTVVPESKIDVVSLANGNIKGLFFEIGDKVYKNAILANLFSDSMNTNYSNAQINYYNMQNNLEAVKRLADENIRQAELGVESAMESVESARISIQTAQENYSNSLSLQDKGTLDARDNAVISFYEYLNFIITTLDQINYIINAENGIQLDGIADTLSVLDPQSLTNATNNYIEAKASYNRLKSLSPDQGRIEDDLEKVINTLDLTKQAVDNTIEVLDNTIESASFSKTSLSTQRSNFSLLRSNTVKNQNSAEALLNSLENLPLNNKQQTDQLENAIEAAENQLELAQVSYNNSLVALESAKKSREQQEITAQASVDTSQGQLNIAGSQLSELVIKAPINGTITNKYVEIGTEVVPGQKIAEISQIDKLKIEISLPSEDIYKIKEGQAVEILDDLIAEISSIDPAADPITKKVKVTLSFDNKDKNLISGTFVDVFIPVENLEKTQENSFFIPLKSVNIGSSENYVFVNNNGIAEKKVVEIGKSVGSLVEVLNGLSNEDELITDGSKNLKDGEEIFVKN